MSDEDDPDQPDEPDDLLPSEQPTISASSPKALRKRKLSLKAKLRDADEFLRSLLADPRGRRFLWDVLQAGHCFDPRFECGPNGFPQPEATWFRAGEQSLAQRLYHTWARADRAGVLLMHDENDHRFAKPKGAE